MNRWDTIKDILGKHSNYSTTITTGLNELVKKYLTNPQNKNIRDDLHIVVYYLLDLEIEGFINFFGIREAKYRINPILFRECADYALERWEKKLLNNPEKFKEYARKFKNYSNLIKIFIRQGFFERLKKKIRIGEVVISERIKNKDNEIIEDEIFGEKIEEADKKHKIKMLEDSLVNNFWKDIKKLKRKDATKIKICWEILFFGMLIPERKENKFTKKEIKEYAESLCANLQSSTEELFKESLKYIIGQKKADYTVLEEVKKVLQQKDCVKNIEKFIANKLFESEVEDVLQIVTKESEKILNNIMKLSLNTLKKRKERLCDKLKNFPNIKEIVKKGKISKETGEW